MFLTDYTDNEYDFHYVVFQGPKGSFGVPHLVRITFGIPGDSSHHQAERLAFIPEESNAPSVYFEKDGWVMRGDGSGNYELAFNLDGIANDYDAPGAWKQPTACSLWHLRFSRGRDSSLRGRCHIHRINPYMDQCKY